jgi:hypothetical protein
VGDLQNLTKGLTRPEQAVITGDLVFATLLTTTPGPNFTRLVPRAITPWYKIRNQRHMYLWVHNDLVAAVKSARVAFAVDGLLRYGKRTKGRTIIFNGYRTAAGTYLHWYRFTNGELVDIQERVLPNDDARYETEMLSLLKNIAIEADTKLYWTDPLPRLRAENLIYIGIEAFQRIPPVTLARLAPAWQRFGPVVIPVAALTVYLLAIGTQWASFLQARSQYEQLASAGPRSAESLEVLRARQAWLAAPNPMQARIAPLPALFRTIGAHPTWQIQKLQLNAPTKSPQTGAMPGLTQIQPQKAADLQLTISIPKDDAVSPLDQAQAPLIELANATALPLHVAAPPLGLTERAVPGGKQLYIVIESTGSKGTPPQAQGQVLVGNPTAGNVAINP